MELVVGISASLAKYLRQITDPEREVHLEEVPAVMFSYAEVRESSKLYWKLGKQGARAIYKPDVRVYMDNGSFTFASTGYEGSLKAYENFLKRSKPDWASMPRDYIPKTYLSYAKKRECMQKTMENNLKYAGSDAAMILHCGDVFDEYLEHFKSIPSLRSPKAVALGEIRAARGLYELGTHIKRTRAAFPESKLHLFAIGSRSTTHLATLLGADSADSVNWYVASSKMGQVESPDPAKPKINLAPHLSERTNKPTSDDYADLEKCPCPFCQGGDGIELMKGKGRPAANARAGHNLYHLMDEIRMVQYHVKEGTYDDWQRQRDPKSFQILSQLLYEQPTQQLAFDF